MKHPSVVLPVRTFPPTALFGYPDVRAFILDMARPVVMDVAVPANIIVLDDVATACANLHCSPNIVIEAP
jgi:hypothetical protein